MTSPATGPDRPLWNPPPDGTPEAEHTTASPHSGRGGHGSHRWMMMICCIPMAAIVVVLLATGAAGSGALLWALGCVAMMAAMMFMMPGGHDHK
jgi:hypothetical protein